MTRYLFKRILLFIPTLIVVSIVAFGLSKLAPGDSVLKYLDADPYPSVASPANLRSAENTYRIAAEKLNLDKPPFYFSITTAAYPDTLYRIFPQDRREVLEKLIAQYGNWPHIQAYYQNIRSLQFKTLAMPDGLRSKAIQFKLNLGELYVHHADGNIVARLERMEEALAQEKTVSGVLGDDFLSLKDHYQKMKGEATPGLLKVPAIHWHGFDNQYHRWLTGFLQGDFGISVFEKIPVIDKVGPALVWTLLLNFFAILLAFLLSVPLGVWSAVKQDKRFDNTASLGLFMLYSLPSFWIGTMLLVFFTTREYGMDIFPGPGLGDIPVGASWGQRISTALPHLILPVICITYPILAFIARQARGGMVDVLSQDYIRTARAKGLSEQKVIWKHGFRNALFPLITLLATVIPGAISGAVTIEFVFNIPGMGLTTLNAIQQQDWPIVFTILMLGSVLTIVGVLLADILYALLDPRVKFS